MPDAEPSDDPGGPSSDVPHLVRTAAAVVIGRAQLARRQLRRGDDPAALDGHFTAMEAAMRTLIEAVETHNDRRR